MGKALNKIVGFCVVFVFASLVGGLMYLEWTFAHSKPISLWRLSDIFLLLGLAFSLWEIVFGLGFRVLFLGEEEEEERTVEFVTKEVSCKESEENLAA